MLPGLAPATGPYCRAARSGRTLRISGQAAAGGKGEAAGNTMPGQTGQALRGFKTILDYYGLSWENVVKTNVYLTDIDAFSKMNAAYARHFGNHRPAGACVEVSRLARGLLVEIEGIAEYGC